MSPTYIGRMKHTLATINVPLNFSEKIRGDTNDDKNIFFDVTFASRNVYVDF